MLFYVDIMMFKIASIIFKLCYVYRRRRSWII